MNGSRKWLFSFLLPTLVWAHTATADERVASSSEQTAQPSAVVEPGFVSLFNGRDLTGWKEVQGDAGSFNVRDGVIVGLRKKGTAYWLSTDKQYGDFELRLQYLLKKKGNSGVFIRVPSYDGRTSVKGMEIQLLDDAGKNGTPGKGETGAIYREVAANSYASKAAGEWNDLTIRCEGDLITIAINGRQVNKVNVNDHRGLKDRPKSGYIGLSAHTDEVCFRNIRIMPL